MEKMKNSNTCPRASYISLGWLQITHFVMPTGILCSFPVDADAHILGLPTKNGQVQMNIVFHLMHSGRWLRSTLLKILVVLQTSSVGNFCHSEGRGTTVERDANEQWCTGQPFMSQLLFSIC